MSSWISTKDGLPKKEGKYLTASNVTDNIVLYEVLNFGKVRKNGMCFYEYDHDMNRRIETPDAWMPIEPYGGEQ